MGNRKAASPARRAGRAAVVAGTLVLSLPAAAWAHPVFVSSASVPANSDQKLSFHVPEEKGPDVHNTKVVFVLPEGFADARCDDKPQWSCAVSGASNGRTVVTYTRTAGNGVDDRFSFGVRTPGRPGDYAIPTHQSYSDRTTVRWDGPPDSEYPAPVLKVT
ncbi:MAG: DUF1775 domain-containing protein [Actinomycetota bacterium]|jgi:uncharacterized protein YcnI